MTLSYDEYCEKEDVRGRRCHLGPGHEGACRFGGFVPSRPQEIVIARLARNPVCHIGRFDSRSVKALVRMALVEIHDDIVGNPTLARLTKAGERVAFYLGHLQGGQS